MTNTKGATAARGRKTGTQQGSILEAPTAETPVMPPEVAANKAVQEGLTSSERLVAQAKALQVTNPDEYRAAAETLQRLRGAYRRLEDDRKGMTDPLRLSIDRIMAFFRPRTQALEEAGNIVRRKLADFDEAEEQRRLEEQRKREAEARKAREEQERKEREAREKAERERAEAQRAQREREEAERRAREEQERAEQARRDEEAARLRGEAEAAERARREREAAELEARRQKEEAEQRAREAAAAERAAERADSRADAAAEAAVSVVAPVVDAEPTKVEGIARKKVWKWSVTDAEKHNRKYLILDTKQVDKIVKALGKDAEELVGGISVRQEFDVAARAK